MAIINARMKQLRGPYADFDKSKALDGEFQVVTANDPNVPSGKAVYIAFAAGDVRRLVSIEDIEQMVADGDFQGAPGTEGPEGPKGKDGATFTPSVSAEGILSWTNNGNLSNPETVNIKGPQGKTGEDGIGIKILDSLNSESELPQSAEVGDAYIINGYLYAYTKDLVFKNFGVIVNPKEPDYTPYADGHTIKFYSKSPGDVASVILQVPSSGA